MRQILPESAVFPIVNRLEQKYILVSMAPFLSDTLQHGIIGNLTAGFLNSRQTLEDLEFGLIT